MKIEINTNNFNYSYNNKQYDYFNDYTNLLVLELYRNKLYNKLKQKLLNKINKYYIKQNVSNEEMNDKNKYLSRNLALDILSLIIFNHKFNSNYDPIFDDISPYNKKNLTELFSKQKLLPTISNKLIKDIIIIFQKISKYYLKYYNKLKQKKNKINKIKYTITFDQFDIYSRIYVTLEDNNIIKDYTKEIKMANHIFNHLIKLYNNKNNTNINADNIYSYYLLEYIYICFIRYLYISNGNNQASILPSIKKKIKELFNIKIELFGSVLNTSNFTFGSYFYDIEQHFGSIGDYFTLDINKGYYEMNPPFNTNLINNMFLKINSELLKADQLKAPLLFLIIIPESYFKINKILSSLEPYIIYNKMLDKKLFPYIVYDKKFERTNIINVTNTRIILLHNNYINEYVKKNIKSNIFFNEIIKIK